jgi:predicted Fe-Mo cluster-binding NifX family protein
MKIAVSAQSSGLESPIDPRFGRARWFILYDTDSDVFEAFSNEQVLNLPQGAGIQAARQVADRSAEVVLTGHCGPKAFQTLQAAGIRVVVGVSGSVRDAIDRFKSGQLEPADRPDVQGHW